MSEVTKHDAYAALRIRDFRILLLTRFAITIAGQLEVVVVRYQVYGLTHDPLPIGIAGLVEAIPALIVALFAGHLADRVNRRTVIIWSHVALVLSACGLLAISLFTQQIYSAVGLFPIY